MRKFIVFIFFIFQSCPVLLGQDWVCKIGKNNTMEDVNLNYCTEWNKHYVIAYISDINARSYNLAIVNKNAEIVKTINIKAKNYPIVYLQSIKEINHKLVLSGYLGTSLYLQEGYFFELDTCFNVQNFTKIEHTNKRDSFSWVYGFAKYEPNEKIMHYYPVRKRGNRGDGIVYIKNNQQVNSFYTIGTIYYLTKNNNRFYFGGNNYVPVYTDKKIGALKGLHGSFNTNLSDLKFNYYRHIDSNNYSSVSTINKVNQTNKSIVTIVDRSWDISSNPDVWCQSTLAIIDNKTNIVVKEKRFFTDTNFAEYSWCQLVSNDNKIYTFTVQGDWPFYRKAFMYMHDINLNLIVKKQISNLQFGAVCGFWDSDSNIVLYSYFLDKGIQSTNSTGIILKYDKNLNPIINTKNAPYVPLCPTIPTNIVLDNYKVLTLTHDTTKYINEPPVVKLTDDYFLMYPNPTSGMLTIDIPFEEKYKIDVFDINGKKVINNQMLDYFNNQIQLNEYAKGLYLVVIKTLSNNIVYSQKIIKG